jgi:hypothetical protein
MVQAPAGEPGPGVNVNLSVPVQKSTGLNSWEAAGTMTLAIPKTGGKEFYRLSVEGAEVTE